jgi:hypothetical protein
MGFEYSLCELKGMMQFSGAAGDWPPLMVLAEDTLRFLLRKRKSGKAYLESVLNKGCCEVLCCE